MKYDIHPDYQKLNVPIFMDKLLLPLMQAGTKILFQGQNNLYNTKSSYCVIDTYKNRKIRVGIFSPVIENERMPCLLFIHGGAFALYAADYHKRLICEYSKKVNCKVVYIDYGLVPKYPFPYGLEDCYAAYKWIIENSNELKIDIEKIAVCGDSAGGALAAGLTQLIRDRKAPQLLFQMLIYPVIDIKQDTCSMKTYHDTPMWNSKLNSKMWRHYLVNVHDRKYASPIETEDLSNLPGAYIEVAQFDCLHDEGLEYAEKLKKSGVEVTVNDTLGTIHGFDYNDKTEYSREIIGKRVNYMKNAYK
ncbi:MAG: alpha/beta hydrolase [Treponema sp.]|jgi:acetyl esterase/lipase|nr:alpha/beta hydrolase [Treponema sp.]